MQLTVENLKVSYGNIKALHGLQFEIEHGEIVCIIGANGAGKSTTLRAISRLDAELRQASVVGLEAFRQAVLKSLLVPTVGAELGGALREPAALTDIIKATAAGIAASDGATQQLEVLLPEAQRERLEATLMARLQGAIRAGVEVKFDEGFKLGFQLAPKGGGYLFDFSESGLRDVFVKYLAPRFRKYFFGSG